MTRDLPELYDGKKNFWDVVVSFTLIDPFRKFWKDDRSYGKKRTSAIMWAITLMYHPDSDIFNVSDKVEQVSKSILGDTDYDWSKYQYLIDAFVDITTSQAKKSLIAMEQRLKERDAFMKSIDYSLDYFNEDGRMVKGTAEQLDGMESRTVKLYDNYFSIKKRLEEENIAEKKKGNKIESLSDSGEI